MPVNARLVIRDADADGAGFLDSFYGESAIQAATARAATDDALARAWFCGIGSRSGFSRVGGSTELMRLRQTGHSMNYNNGKAAFTHLHVYLNTLAVDLAAEGVAHPVAEVHAAHNFPAFGHHGSYLVAHDDDLTHAEKVAWAVSDAWRP